MMKAKVGSRERAGFFTYAFAILMVMAALGPFVYVVLTALKSPEQIYNAEEIIPSYITFSNFTGVLTRSLFVRYFLNSVYITLVTMSISMVMAVLAAYGFTRYHIFGANTMKTTILMTRMFPGILLCLPFYIIMKNLGLIDSHLGLILMYLSFTLPFAIWNLCAFFAQMPWELEEAAMIDGCNPIQIFFKVVCPILKPTMISTAILETMWVWNDYLLPTLVLDIKKYRTIPMAIQYFRGG